MLRSQFEVRSDRFFPSSCDRDAAWRAQILDDPALVGIVDASYEDDDAAVAADYLDGANKTWTLLPPQPPALKAHAAAYWAAMANGVGLCVVVLSVFSLVARRFGVLSVVP